MWNIFKEHNQEDIILRQTNNPLERYNRTLGYFMVFVWYKYSVPDDGIFFKFSLSTIEVLKTLRSLASIFWLGSFFAMDLSWTFTQLRWHLNNTGRNEVANGAYFSTNHKLLIHYYR
jgi:hypothetical protein